MGLTGSQKEEFRDALLAAIPEAAELAQYVEVAFDRTYNDLAKGESVYRLACSNLVDWAARHGQLIALARMVSTRVPGNPEFEAFLERHWLTLLKSETRTLPDNLLEALGGYLQFMHDFATVADCCRRTWSKIEVDRPQVLWDLENDALCSTTKWLSVLGLWLKTVTHRADGTPHILTFVQRLQDCPVLDAQLQDNLALWLSQAKSELDVTLPTPAVQQQFPKVRGYCVIDVDILETQATLNYLCQLHIQVGDNDEWSENQLLPIANKSEKELPPLPDTQPLDPREAIYRSPQFLPIRQQMGYWLTQAEQRLSDKCADLKQRYDLVARPESDLLVEFCLPWKYLVEGVDVWEFIVKRRRLQKVNLGRRYKVVVRSRDRIQDLYGEINQLNRIWNDNRELREGSVTPDDWAKVTPILADFESIKSIDDDQLANEFEGYVGMGVSGPLCCADHSESRQKLLDNLLEAGVPVVMWSRDHEIENLDPDLRDLLVVEHFRDFNRLIDRTKEMRSQASPPQPLGYHLAVWCDEPRRIEALNELFANKARLG